MRPRITSGHPEQDFCMCKTPTIEQFGEDRFLCEDCGCVITPNTMKALQIQSDFKALADLREAAEVERLAWIGEDLQPLRTFARILGVPVSQIRQSNYRNAPDRLRAWGSGLIVLFFDNPSKDRPDHVRDDCQWICERGNRHRFFMANSLLDRLDGRERTG